MALHPVPLTLEGAAVLHQMYRLRRAAWRAADRRKGMVDTLADWLTANPRSAAYSLFGHKGDILLLHFRDSFDDLKSAESDVDCLELSSYLEPSSSYLSVVELGLYDSSLQLFSTLAERNVEPHSPEWNTAVHETEERQRKAMHPRLYPEIPPSPWLCFYPMDRKRGEDKNWYSEDIVQRQRMMHEHGLVGRRYAGLVKQIITGSIGFDDWEWGVDLFADDPLVFKRLIYEMRFDEVSAVYALFGTFYLGRRLDAESMNAAFEI